ncbi:MAG: hypothetical protein ACI8RZ_003981 [Myxococcota bacterium]|jgi:hypothetical protein
MFLLVLALPAAASAVAPQTFDFDQSTALSLILPAGNVTVRPGESLSVTVTPTDWSDRCRLETGEDAAARVEIRQPRKAPVCAADVAVTVPRGMRLRVDLEAGDVTLGDTDAAIDLLIGTGDIALEGPAGSVFTDIEVGSLTGRAAGGLLATLHEGDVSVSWAGLPTGDIHVLTHHGDVKLGLPADVLLTGADRQPASFRAVLSQEKTVQADAQRGAVVVTPG